MKIELLLDNRRPWRIGNHTSPPRDRFIEIAHMGTTLIAAYSEKHEAWIAGSAIQIECQEITRWRESAPELQEHLRNKLTNR